MDTKVAYGYTETVTKLINDKKCKIDDNDLKTIVTMLIEEFEVNGYKRYKYLSKDTIDGQAIINAIASDFIKILRRVDVTNKRALDIAYKLFVKTSKNALMPQELLDIIE